MVSLGRWLCLVQNVNKSALYQPLDVSMYIQFVSHLFNRAKHYFHQGNKISMSISKFCYISFIVTWNINWVNKSSSVIIAYSDITSKWTLALTLQKNTLISIVSFMQLQQKRWCCVHDWKAFESVYASVTAFADTVPELAFFLFWCLEWKIPQCWRVCGFKNTLFFSLIIRSNPHIVTLSWNKNKYLIKNLRWSLRMQFLLTFSQVQHRWFTTCR